MKKVILSLIVALAVVVVLVQVAAYFDEPGVRAGIAKVFGK